MHQTPTIDRGNSTSSYTSATTYSDRGSWKQPSAQPSAADYYAAPAQQKYQQYVAESSQPQPPAQGTSAWRDHELVRTMEDIKRPLELHEDYQADEEEYFYDEEDPSEDGDDRFFNPALLSHIAVRLRDKVPRGTHVKGSIPYPRAFTGKDIVVCSILTLSYN